MCENDDEKGTGVTAKLQQVVAVVVDEFKFLVSHPKQGTVPKRGEGETQACRVEWVEMTSGAFRTCYDVWFGDCDTDQRRCWRWKS